MKQIKIFESIGSKSTESNINKWLEEHKEASIITCELIRPAKNFVYDLFILYEPKAPEQTKQ